MGGAGQKVMSEQEREEREEHGSVCDRTDPWVALEEAANVWFCEMGEAPRRRRPQDPSYYRGVQNAPAVEHGR